MISTQKETALNKEKVREEPINSHTKIKSVLNKDKV
jgi:hypothetical protein